MESDGKENTAAERQGKRRAAKQTSLSAETQTEREDREGDKKVVTGRDIGGETGENKDTKRVRD